MSLWEQFKRWFFSSTRRRHQDTHPDIRPLDVARLAADLRLRERAQELGKAGLPASDAVQLSAPEFDVVQRVEKACLDYVTWANTRLSVLNGTIRSHDVRPIVDRATQSVDEFERRANALLAESKGALDELKTAAESRRRELAAFRTQHNLTREAHYPTRTRAILGYVILGLLVCMEGLLNAYFFAKGLESGLIGGFIWAAIFALMNLGGSYLIGKMAVPYVFHSRVWGRALGGAGSVGALAWLVSMSLMIAHYRDALVAAAESPERAAMQSLLSTPLALHDISSLLLCLISGVFALFAVFDGIASDDKYPGYGKAAQKAADALADYEEELQLLREELDELREEQLAGLEKDVEKAKAFIASQASDIETKVATASRLANLMDDARNCAASLLRSFRDANELTRPGARPSYFNAPLVLKNFDMPDFGVATDEATLQGQRQLLQQLVNKEQTLRAQIQAAFTEKFDRLKPLGAQFSAGPGYAA